MPTHSSGVLEDKGPSRIRSKDPSQTDKSLLFLSSPNFVDLNNFWGDEEACLCWFLYIPCSMCFNCKELLVSKLNWLDLFHNLLPNAFEHCSRTLQKDQEENHLLLEIGITCLIFTVRKRRKETDIGNGGNQGSHVEIVWNYGIHPNHRLASLSFIEFWSAICQGRLHWLGGSWGLREKRGEREKRCERSQFLWRGKD